MKNKFTFEELSFFSPKDNRSYTYKEINEAKFLYTVFKLNISESLKSFIRLWCR